MLHKWKSGGMKTPIARAKGLGAAGHGSEHWLAQRVTAVANIPLVLWALYSFINNIGASHAQFTAWLAQPVNAVLMIFFIVSVFYHAFLGAQVVVEDYVHNEALKMIKLICQKLFFIGVAIACIFCVLQIAFTG